MPVLGAEPGFPRRAQGMAPTHACSQRIDARDLSGVLIWRRALEIGGKTPSLKWGAVQRSGVIV